MTIQSSIQSFNFQNQSVRTIADEKGEFWFLANDVCGILGYVNPRRTIDLHCKSKGVTKRYTPTESGNQEMTYINEPNLYRLIIKSRKPEAEAFEEWVMEDVLPTIRKTGGYQTSGSLPLQQPQLPAEYFAHLAKMAHYAEDYQKIQSLLCTDPKGEQAQKLMTSFNYSTNSNQTGYLFVFKPNIQQDVKQAFDFLYQYSQKI